MIFIEKIWFYCLYLRKRWFLFNNRIHRSNIYIILLSFHLFKYLVLDRSGVAYYRHPYLFTLFTFASINHFVSRWTRKKDPFTFLRFLHLFERCKLIIIIDILFRRTFIKEKMSETKERNKWSLSCHAFLR
jgi:hypothetical protein